MADPRTLRRRVEADGNSLGRFDVAGRQAIAQYDDLAGAGMPTQSGRKVRHMLTSANVRGFWQQDEWATHGCKARRSLGRNP